jgi:hypothetical protein
MTDIPEPQSPKASGGTVAPDLPDEARRRFIGRAALLAPAIVTLTSAPSFGTTFSNCTLSGWVHLTASVAPSGMQVRGNCGFRSPGYWMSAPHAPWPLPRTTPFYVNGSDGVFTTPNTFDSKYVDPAANPALTLRDVLSPSYAGSLAWFAIAHLFNAMTAPGYPLAAGEVIAMYNAVAGGGEYITASGARLDLMDVKNFWEQLQSDPGPTPFNYYTPPLGV